MKPKLEFVGSSPIMGRKPMGLLDEMEAFERQQRSIATAIRETIDICAPPQDFAIRWLDMARKHDEQADLLRNLLPRLRRHPFFRFCDWLDRRPRLRDFRE